MCNLPYSEKPFISRIVVFLMDRLGLSVSLTDVIAALSWPKNWIIENVIIHFAFSFYALVEPTFRVQPVTYWLSWYLTTRVVLAAKIFLNVMTAKG
jgi:hypothetical protein